MTEQTKQTRKTEQTKSTKQTMYFAPQVGHDHEDELSGAGAWSEFRKERLRRAQHRGQLSTGTLREGNQRVWEPLRKFQ